MLFWLRLLLLNMMFVDFVHGDVFGRFFILILDPLNEEATFCLSLPLLVGISQIIISFCLLLS